MWVEVLSNVLSITAQNTLRNNVLWFGDLLRRIGQRLYIALTPLDPRKCGYQRKLEFSFLIAGHYQEEN